MLIQQFTKSTQNRTRRNPMLDQNWKMKLLNILREHAWQLTPEQQFMFAVTFMFKVAKEQSNV